MQGSPTHLQPLQMMTEISLIMTVQKKTGIIEKQPKYENKYHPIVLGQRGRSNLSNPKKGWGLIPCWPSGDTFSTSLLSTPLNLTPFNPLGFGAVFCSVHRVVLTGNLLFCQCTGKRYCKKCCTCNFCNYVLCYFFQFQVNHPNFRLGLLLIPASSWPGKLPMRKKES